MVGYVPAALDLVYGDAPFREKLPRGEEVRLVRAAA